MENGSSSLQENKKGESLTPKELMKKHLQDPNHQVTDEELMNLKVGSDAEDEALVDKEADARSGEIDDLPDNDTLPNLYTVLR